MAVRFTPAPNLAGNVRRVTAPGRKKVAAAVVADARILAPVVTGAYRDGFAVSSSGDAVSVVNTDPTATYKEYGTVDTPAHGTMAAAASRHGKLLG